MDREEILNKAGEAVAQKNFGEAKQLLEDYIKEINDTDIEVEKRSDSATSILTITLRQKKTLKKLLK